MNGIYNLSKSPTKPTYNNINKIKQPNIVVNQMMCITFAQKKTKNSVWNKSSLVVAQNK
jgi:hypothetical protein